MYKKVCQTLTFFKKWIGVAYKQSKIQEKNIYRSSPTEVFLGKGVLKMCSKFTGEHPCWSCKGALLKSNFGMGVLL